MASKHYPQDQLHVENCSKFCAEVETLIITKNMNYMEAVLILAEQRNIEVEMAATYLSPDIIEHLRIEGENLNLLQRTATLPF